MINKMLHGDCLELMKDIPNGSIDMILCDLPYGTTQCKWDSVIPFEPLWKEYERIIKPNGAIVLTASQPFTSALIMSNINLFKYELIWEKSNPTGMGQANKRPMKYHENISMKMFIHIFSFIVIFHSFLKRRLKSSSRSRIFILK